MQFQIEFQVEKKGHEFYVRSRQEENRSGLSHSWCLLDTTHDVEGVRRLINEETAYQLKHHQWEDSK